MTDWNVHTCISVHSWIHLQIGKEIDYHFLEIKHVLDYSIATI